TDVRDAGGRIWTLSARVARLVAVDRALAIHRPRAARLARRAARYPALPAAASESHLPGREAGLEPQRSSGVRRRVEAADARVLPRIAHAGVGELQRVPAQRRL